MEVIFFLKIYRRLDLASFALCTRMSSLNTFVDIDTCGRIANRCVTFFAATYVRTNYV